MKKIYILIILIIVFISCDKDKNNNNNNINCKENETLINENCVCKTDYHREDETCISNIKTVKCIKDEIENSTAIVRNVDIHYNDNSWEDIPFCENKCNKGYYLLGDICEKEEYVEEINPPKKDNTVAGNFYDDYSFIFDGENKVQFGTKEGIFKKEQIAILSGKVFDEENNPLSRVRISILNHPEFGYTYTRKNGEYDIAVNGGKNFVIDYKKDDFINVQRRVDSSWHKFSFSHDVIMIGYDKKVTKIDLENQTNIEVVKGSVVEDDNGIRQIALFIAPETKAFALLDDGSEIELKTISIRASEFTVGENGPKRMPSELPPNVAYTYCVEFSVDEAIKLGAYRVNFDKTIYTYLDNFLDLPVGSIVPNGYYNRKTALWEAEEDGVVIKILSINGKVVEVDSDGDDLPDDENRLLDLGFSSKELEKLAEIYEEGDSLWRFPITHFSPHDPNQPGYVDAEARVGKDPKIDHKDDPCNKSKGSIIGVEDQSLGEVLPIFGTNYSLYYNSKLEKNNNRLRTIIIPVRERKHSEAEDGEFLSLEKEDSEEDPGSGPIGENDKFMTAKSVKLEIEVAGQVTKIDLGSEPPLAYKFVWDGKDKYGRYVNGMAKANVKIIYEYPVYYDMKAMQLAGIKSFALVSSSRGSIYYRSMAIMKKLRNLSYDVYNYVRPNKWHLGINHSYDVKNDSLLTGRGELIKNDKLYSFKSVAKIEPDYYYNFTFDREGNIYYVNENIYKYDIRNKTNELILEANSPVKLKIDDNDNLYFMEDYQIKKYNLNTKELSVLVGSGNKIYSGVGFDKSHAVLKAHKIFYDRVNKRLWIIDRRSTDKEYTNRLLYIGKDNILRRSNLELLETSSEKQLMRGITGDNAGNVYLLTKTSLIKIDSNLNASYIIHERQSNCPKQENTVNINNACISGGLDIDVDNQGRIYILDFYKSSDGSSKRRIRRIENNEVSVIIENENGNNEEIKVGDRVDELEYLSSNFIKIAPDGEMYIYQYMNFGEYLIKFNLDSKKISKVIGGGSAYQNPMEGESINSQNFGLRTRSINFDEQNNLQRQQFPILQPTTVPILQVAWFAIGAAIAPAAAKAHQTT